MWECVLVCRAFTLTKKGTILRVFFCRHFSVFDWMARRTIIRIGKMAAKNERPEQANPVTDPCDQRYIPTHENRKNPVDNFCLKGFLRLQNLISNVNRSWIFLKWYTVDTSEIWQFHESWDLSGRRRSYQPELVWTAGFLKNQQQAFGTKTKALP